MIKLSSRNANDRHC